MKTLLSTMIICISLYAGIGAIKSTTSNATKHNQELQQAIDAMK